MNLTSERELFEIFRKEAISLLDKSLHNIEKLTEKYDEKILFEVYSSVHTVKGESVFFGLKDVAQTLHSVEDEIIKWRNEKKVSPDSLELVKKKLVFSDAMLRSFIPQQETIRDVIEQMKRFFDEYSKILGKPADMDIQISSNLSQSEISEVLHIFINLVRNAFEHAFSYEKNNKMVFSVSKTEKAGKSKIEIFYEDNGSGFDPEIIKKIEKKGFEAILGVSTKEPSLHSGRGMGLYSIYKLAKDKKGGIIIKSEKNKGTSMKIYYFSS
ncbi:hypothetical protein HRbin19_01613 [bacterium HR19]|nr:hypothetical protein HRbin19_01613 [bacterium HR19]